MERGFLSQKGSGVGRGVKENGSNGSYLEASFGPFDMYMEKEKLYSLEDTTVLGSFPPLPTQVTNSTGNAP
ncbi:hypothetical protein Tco_1117697, partial [Tanacetum coccineum]